MTALAVARQPAIAAFLDLDRQQHGIWIGLLL
jgi:hypothetical protein